MTLARFRRDFWGAGLGLVGSVMRGCFGHVLPDASVMRVMRHAQNESLDCVTTRCWCLRDIPSSIAALGQAIKRGFGGFGIGILAAICSHQLANGDLAALAFD